MENFNRANLSVFVHYAATNDMQVLANKRHGKILYMESLDPDGTFSFPADKADKVLTFLVGCEQSTDNNIAVYAFVKLLSELRRCLRVSTCSTSVSEAGDATTSAPHSHSFVSGGGALPP